MDSLATNERTICDISVYFNLHQTTAYDIDFFSDTTSPDFNAWKNVIRLISQCLHITTLRGKNLNSQICHLYIIYRSFVLYSLYFLCFF